MGDLETGPFLSALSLTTLAELGDKSFMVLLALATTHGRVPVLAGAVAAFAVLNLAAVALGAALADALPVRALLGASGLLFLTLAVLAWRSAGDEDDEAEAERRSSARHPFVVTFTALLVAEMGDKTQIAIAGLAARFDEPAWVFAGGTLGLALVSVVAVTAGAALARQLPTALLHRLGAVVFAVFGALALVEAARG